MSMTPEREAGTMSLSRRAAETVRDGEDSSEELIAETAKEIEAVTHADEMREVLRMLRFSDTKPFVRIKFHHKISDFRDKARTILDRIARELEG